VFQTRYLLAFNAVPQLTGPPRAPSSVVDHIQNVSHKGR